MWRALKAADAAAVEALAEACHQHDGGLGPLFSRIPPGVDRVARGAFAPDGACVAWAGVGLIRASREARADIIGLTHPDCRRRGLGRRLLRWSLARAGRMLAQIPEEPVHIIVVSTEALTDDAAWLYAKHRLSLAFAEDVLSRDLSVGLPTVRLPDTITFEDWTPGNAEAFFDVYVRSFQERPGFPNWGIEQWVGWVSSDDAFRPAMTFLAIEHGQPVGFIVCAADWITQTGVVPEARTRGIASAMVVETLSRFKRANRARVLLDVNVNNPGARRVYDHLGFVPVGRRARYERKVAARHHPDAPGR